ncbi:MAG: Crp/Fnr family transcriptional regulator [Actinobacteria bacterium]|nr:MAG: Crp/Fnr family transcriptional regulator [Actinomycetota bacterium]
MDWPILEGLAGEVKRQVLASGRLRRFGRGEVVFHEGDPADTLHLIAKGRVAVKVSTALGDTATLAVLGQGDFFGELALVGAHVRTATVIALEPVETLAIRRDDFDRLRTEHPSVQAFLVEVLSAEVRRLSGQVTEALYVPADDRVLRRLAELVPLYATSDGEPVEIPLTQEDLATMAGTSRATVNRVLGEAEREGIIALGRMRVTVVDPAALRARSGPD